MAHFDVIGSLWNCKDVESLILKGHLIVELHMNDYIEMRSAEKFDFYSMNFSTKIKVCRILGLFKNEVNLLANVKLLNKVRNDLAHSLKFPNDSFQEYLGGIRSDTLVNEGVNAIFEEFDQVLLMKKDGQQYHISKDFYYFMSKTVSICNRILQTAN